MLSADTEALLATVRKVMPPDIRGLGATGSLDGTDPMQVGRDAHAALDSLTAELEAAKAGDEHYGRIAMDWRNRAEAAEAELERVKAERDEARFEPRRIRDAAGNWNNEVWCRSCGTIHQEPSHCPIPSAQARLDKALAALREIDKMERTSGYRSLPEAPVDFARIARAAIQEIEG